MPCGSSSVRASALTRMNLCLAKKTHRAPEAADGLLMEVEEVPERQRMGLLRLLLLDQSVGRSRARQYGLEIAELDFSSFGAPMAARCVAILMVHHNVGGQNAAEKATHLLCRFVERLAKFAVCEHLLKENEPKPHDDPHQGDE